jgi:pimeloyl-ACP methyl ester carboxylesterase
MFPQNGDKQRHRIACVRPQTVTPINLRELRVRGNMQRRFLLGCIAALCAVVPSCAPFVANHESEVQLMTVNTPAGKLRLAVIDKGQGRPILLLHGLATSSYTWHAIIPDLAKNHRVIAIDLRGFGASDKPIDDHYSIEDQSGAVEAFIEQENLQDLTIIGHSFGGGVTLSLALKAAAEPRPRIRNIVLVDTIAYRQPMPVFFKLFQVPLVADVSMTLVPPEVQAAQGLRLAYYDADKISAQDVAEYASTLYSPAAKHALTKTIEKIIPENIDEIAERYKTIKLPTLILWCERDKVVPVRLGHRLHRAMPAAEFTVFAECGHMPQEEKPKDTLGAIQAFLKRNES